MKKIVKPAGMFWTKPHSYPPPLLRALQNEIFKNIGIKQAAELIAVLDCQTRQQILLVLSKKESLCVGDLADVLRLDISAVSHQLGILRKAGLLTNQRKRKAVYYKLVRDLPAQVKVFLAATG